MTPANNKPFSSSSTFALAVAVAASVVFVAGCARTKKAVYGEPLTPVQQVDVEAESNRFERLVTAERNHGKQRVEVTKKPLVSTKPIPKAKGEWLKQLKITVQEPSRPVAVSEIVRALRAEGINITSQLPLNTFYYSGYGVTDVTADVALDILLGTVGLDWAPNDEYKFVTIQPLPTRSWNLAVGNRKTDFSASSSTSGGGGGSGGGGAGGAGGAAGGGGAGGAGGGGISGITTSNASTSSDSKSGVTVTDDFFKETITELEARLKVIVPASSAPTALGPGGAIPGTPQSAQVAQSVSDAMFREIQVGKVVGNSTTGVITVQAPRGVMNTIEQYMAELDRAYNTRLIFEGRLFLITTTEDRTRGLDFSFFRRFTENFGLALTNNALGGVTITPPINGPLSIATGSQIATQGLGIVSADNLLQVFMGYLEKEGQVTTIQRPLLSTTNGVPSTFSQTDKVYVNNVSQANNATQAVTTTALTNTLIPFEFGTVLKVYPRYDARNERVRASISLVQLIQSGFTEINQFVTGPNGATVPVPTRIPLDRRVEFQGETLLTDGALVILGGQQFTNKNRGGSGLTGLRSSPLGFLFGTETDNDSVSTYYFALSVRTIPVDSAEAF